MNAVLVNYNFTPDWLKDYNFDYLIIYDRSEGDDYLKDFPHVVRTKNIGNVDYDKLTYLIDHYDDMPDVFLWGKTNLFKYITKEEFDLVKNSRDFTPLLTKNHNTYMDHNGVVCFYDDTGMYNERNDSWFVNSMPHQFANYGEFARYLNLPNPPYLAFPPGGNFILTKERVHHYGRDFYEKMRNTLNYCQLPAEAHMAERTYYSLWK